MNKLNLEEARQELDQKSYRDSQIETAFKWGARAAVSYGRIKEVTDQEEKLKFWTVAEEFFHESIEHAALVEDDGNKTLQEVRDAVRPFQEAAFQDLGHIDETDETAEEFSSSDVRYNGGTLE
jgi:hypothetical protein